MNNKIKELLTKILTATTSDWSVEDAWRKEDHPRGGNPKNKGQFSKNSESQPGAKTTIKGHKEGQITATFVKSEKFATQLQTAKESMPEEERWKVSSGSADDYKEAKTYTVAGGTVAITKDGDIVSVCANPQGGAKGYKLLELAIRKGGKKLDSYDGNFRFYAQNGFEPISWTKWDEQWAPDDWKQDFGGQDIVFFKYVGRGKVSKEYLSEDGVNKFYAKVAPSPDYGAAQEARDKSM